MRVIDNSSIIRSTYYFPQLLCDSARRRMHYQFRLSLASKPSTTLEKRSLSGYPSPHLYSSIRCSPLAIVLDHLTSKPGCSNSIWSLSL
ncbi:hypothetical protein CPC08DRAFT_131750 [Agrocybe pediades]|nr:hypothetical protein CPC08DRAFT_131750 [Agrocybe pediades]